MRTSGARTDQVSQEARLAIRHPLRSRVAAAILLGTLSLMSACATSAEVAPTAAEKRVSSPCSSTEMMSSCGKKLTTIVSRTQKTYDGLGARFPDQTDALDSLWKASEYWAANCRNLTVTVGSSDDPQGCRDAMMKMAESAVTIDPTIDD
jgi:hypothetical protein